MGEIKRELPFEETIQEGLLALNGTEPLRESIPALLVSIGAPKLRSLGFRVDRTIPDPETHLYNLLCHRHADAAHSKYNSLIRRLVSFERSARCDKKPTHHTSAA